MACFEVACYRAGVGSADPAGDAIHYLIDAWNLDVYWMFPGNTGCTYYNCIKIHWDYDHQCLSHSTNFHWTIL